MWISKVSAGGSDDSQQAAGTVSGAKSQDAGNNSQQAAGKDIADLSVQEKREAVAKAAAESISKRGIMMKSYFY
eukprot:11575993-Alexandrium_andersonii.AAC.1